MSTLEGHLDPYLNEARNGGGLWAGHLIALTAYTRDVPRVVGARDDVALWVCGRHDDGHPELIQVA